MRYRDIETFLELVRTRNITKTAEHLYLSQSTVSNRLKQLEEDLGYQLIVRAKGQRAITLTRQGQDFVPIAERWKLLFEETESLRKSSLSTLRLGVSESTFYEILTPFLLEFLPAYPNCKISVQICDSEHIYDLVEKNLIDFGFPSYDASRPSTESFCLDSRKLCIIRYCENPRPGLCIHPRELDPKKEIRFTGGHFSNFNIWREKWFGFSHEERMEINTSRGIVPFLSSGDYWALAPIDVARNLSKEMSLQIYDLEDQPAPWKVFLLKKRDSHSLNIEIRRDFETALLAYMKRQREEEE